MLILIVRSGRGIQHLVQIIYAHGFVSQPSSTKAQFFSGTLSALGLTVHVPNLNGDSFPDLTLTNQIETIGNIIENAGSDCILIGASMGGLVSVLTANRFPRVKGLILMAPAFGLTKRWHERFHDQLPAWKEQGSIDILHHAYGRNLPLKYGFIEDAGKHQTENLQVSVPTLLIHGTHDDAVPIAESEKFYEQNRQHVEFHSVDSDHQLNDCLPLLWDLSLRFMKNHELLPDNVQIGSR